MALVVTMHAQEASPSQALAAAAGSLAGRTKLSPETALDRYVKTPDPAYAWKLVKQETSTLGTISVLEMTSQKWMTEAEVDVPLWKHWLTIITPAEVRHQKGLLIISGGSRRGDPPKPASESLQLARGTGSIVAELRDVPNQPLVFVGDGKPLKEDDTIAYTWKRFMDGGSDLWPLRLPMTKAAVRAMDTVTAFCATPEGGKHAVEKFVVSGASKRGWTTWSTAAVDERVVAIAPIVIDVLNVTYNLSNHWRNYGFWAPAVRPYSAIGLEKYVGTPQFDRLMTIEDPYRYRARFTLPKFLLNAAGDQFFPCDSSHGYYQDLVGPKTLRYVPNADHGLGGSDALISLLAWYQCQLTGTALPEFTWKSDKEGHLAVKDTAKLQKPVTARLWKATNAEGRDFRLEKIGKSWVATDLAISEDGAYETQVSKPEKGWTAFFMEFTYVVAGGSPITFTTEVEVTPRRQPHPFPAK